MTKATDELKHTVLYATVAVTASTMMSREFISRVTRELSARTAARRAFMPEIVRGTVGALLRSYSASAMRLTSLSTKRSSRCSRRARRSSR